MKTFLLRVFTLKRMCCENDSLLFPVKLYLNMIRNLIQPILMCMWPQRMEPNPSSTHVQHAHRKPGDCLCPAVTAVTLTQQWFAMSGDLASLGTAGKLWRPHTSRGGSREGRERYKYLVGRGRKCSETLHNAQDKVPLRPPNKELSSPRCH